MRTKRLLFVMFCALFMACFLSACSTTQSNLTPQEKYYTAVSWYNDNLSLYLSHYQAASPATKEEWKSNVDPLFKTGARVLDAWKLSLGTSGGAANSEQLWNNIRTELLGLFIHYGFITVVDERS